VHRFAGPAEAEESRHRASHIRQLTIPGHGALDPGHRRRQDPQTPQITDLSHAREHLHDLARPLEPVPGHPPGARARFWGERA
jgi:hypothetical protein